MYSIVQYSYHWRGYRRTTARAVVVEKSVRLDARRRPLEVPRLRALAGGRALELSQCLLVGCMKQARNITHRYDTRAKLESDILQNNSVTYDYTSNTVGAKIMGHYGQLIKKILIL